jgi:L-alanine-DL-glutamate epimerase-like enolase superfamily enzyme
MRLNLSYKNLDLKLKEPFTIARGTKETAHNVLVELSDGKHTGYGEAAPNRRYNEDAAKVKRWLESVPDGFFDDIETPEDYAAKIFAYGRSLPHAMQSVKSAEAALEMAWLDWWGKSRGEPLWKLWDAPDAAGPVTSYTIGLDEIEVMQEKVRQAAEYPIYKVKLGTDRDREIIHALREVTDKPIRVDANEGWTSLDQAKEMTGFLADHNIELVEQPMPADRHEDLKQLSGSSPLPLCADESFTGEESISEIAKAFDIINIKLMKTGSLIKAKKIMEEAGRHDVQVMIGCMIESSVANTAGALLSLWTDYADLDGHLLIKDDPARGLQLDGKKRIHLNNEPGLGVSLNH